MNRFRYGYLLALLVLLTGQSACESDGEDDHVGNWIKRSDFEGDTRSGAVAFVIGEKVYVGTGYNTSKDTYYNDFWVYDPQLNFWQAVAPFPGAARSNAVAFSIGDIGYVGTGYDGDDEVKDFWAYNPVSNSWTRKADFAGSARREAVGFSLNDTGYIGSGYDGSNTKDFWQYSPATDSWSQIPSIGGSKRKGAVAFVIDEKAYVGTGTNNGAYQFDFWALDASLISTDQSPWLQLHELDQEDDYDLIREGAAAFTRSGRGYLVSGTKSSVQTSVWEYEPTQDTWTQKTSFEGAARTHAIGFEVSDRLFVALGKSGSTDFDDIWEFMPFDAYDEED